MAITRTGRIRLAVAASLAGTVALVALAAWTGVRRDTDRADGSAAVSADFLGAPPEEAPALTFTEVAAESGIAVPPAVSPRARLLPEDTGSGLAWGDVDGDGHLDLYVVGYAAPSRLFRNQGGGRFREVAEAGGAADPEGGGMGATFADFDDDGNLDLHVTRLGADRLYRNRGDGSFEEVAAAAGVDDPGWSTGAAWGDFDRDGQLDLYVTRYVEFDAGATAAAPAAGSAAGPGGSAWAAVPYTLNPNSFDPLANRLYRNLGDGGRGATVTFEEVALPSGAADPDGRGLAVTACDLDGDGWLDLYVNNDVSPNALLRNLGGAGFPGMFENLAAATGTADPRGSMGLSVADLAFGGEPDGMPDLFVTHWVAQENALYQAVRGAGGRLEYRDRARDTLLAEASLARVGWGSAFADFDLDGHPDLAVANGSTLERGDDPSQLRAEPLFLFWNDGARFHDLAAGAGAALERSWNARGLAAADYDGDGDVDLAVALNGGGVLLLRNDTETPHRSVAVRLAGPAAATFGARVELVAGGRRQVRWMGCDASFLSGHAPEIVFGLGGDEAAARVRVSWADGAVSVGGPLAAGRTVLHHPGQEP